MLFPVAEKFVSINGESIRAGELAVFIRFRGCNLACSYCDTMWANQSDCNVEMLTEEEISRYVINSRVKNVTLTGGEPLLQCGISSLIKPLMENGNSVEIETNGSISVKELANSTYRPFFTLDYKLPSSGMEQYMLTDNYHYLCENDAVKFVCGSIEDLVRSKEIITQFSLTEKCRVYLSPVFGKIDPADMVGFMINNGMNNVRLQLQLHKFIWDPNKKGV